MRHVLDRCNFETERLRVGPLAAEAERIGIEPAGTIADLLTPQTTVALPTDWQGDFTVERASLWIDERDADSTTLLATEKASGRPVGLLILADVRLNETEVDVRIGYLIGENSWGHGFATELVAGLVEWARTQPPIATLTGGVDPTNQRSVRVLEKCGFRRVHDDGDTVLLQLDVGTG